MIVLKNNDSESATTYSGSVIISIAFILFFVKQFTLGTIMIILGVIVISVAKKVEVKFEQKEAIIFFTVLRIRIPITYSKIRLQDYSKATLYQFSEKGTMTFRVQSVNHLQREFWIRLESNNDQKKSLGYFNDYETAKSVLEEFQTSLGYHIQDLIQERIKRNKIEREKRTRR